MNENKHMLYIHSVYAHTHVHTRTRGCSATPTRAPTAHCDFNVSCTSRYVAAAQARSVGKVAGGGQSQTESQIEPPAELSVGIQGADEAEHVITVARACEPSCPRKGRWANLFMYTNVYGFGLTLTPCSYICMHACSYILFVCMYVGVFVCMYILHMITVARACEPSCPRKCMWVNLCMHVCMYIVSYVYMYIYIVCVCPRSI